LNLSNFSFDYIEEHYLGACRIGSNYRMLNYLGYPTHRLAKDIAIFICDQAVYSGKALEVMSRAPYSGCAFPLARKISFYFVDEAMDVDENGRGFEANIGAFVERIKHMAPLVSEIRVQANNLNACAVFNRYFSDLASRLYRPAHRIDYAHVLDNGDPILLQLDMICNLTHISYTSKLRRDDAYQFMQLAWKTALTLQSLVVDCKHDIDFNNLVQDADGNYVTYPRLLTLKLWTAFCVGQKRPLCIEFDVELVYSGKALKILSNAPYEGFVFPLVHTLEFELTSVLKDRFSLELEDDGTGDHDDNDSDWESESDNSNASRKLCVCPQDTAANIAAFAQRVKQMAPTVSEVNISPHGKADRLFQCDNHHILHLAEELFGIVEKHTVISYDSAHLVIHLNTEPIRDLVRIQYMMDVDATDVTPLIRRSTQTLQFLDIDVHDADASDIFSDPDGGGYLEFPSTHALKISTLHDYKPSKTTVFKGIVPFP
ncbi:hypothetical protein H4S07_002635, partial [Coemansia furcata]